MAVGLREAVWPARMQQLKPGPLAPQEGPPVWIDAAHNPAGATVLTDTIRARDPEGVQKTALVVAMQAVKDVGGRAS